MFVLRQDSTQAERRFGSRDDLLLFLEDYQARLVAESKRETMQLTHVNENGEILGQTQISLPSEMTLDSLLLGFGLEKVKRGRLSKRQKSSMTKDRSKSPEKSLESSSHSPKKIKTIKAKEKRQRISPKYLLGLVMTVFPLLAVLVMSLQLQGQGQKIQELRQEVKQLATTQNHLYQIDVFSRYFLPSYYAGDDNQLAAFVSQSLGNVRPKRQGQLQSVILEGIKPVRDEEYQVTYVLVLKGSDEQKSLLRVMFSVGIARQSLYGYEVISQPEESNYPK